MKICPHCREGFEDDLIYCTFDGSRLSLLPEGAVITGIIAPVEPLSSLRRSSSRGWIFFLSGFLVLCLIGVGVVAVRLINQPRQRPAPAAAPSIPARPLAIESPPPTQEAKPPLSILEIPRARLMEMIPQSLLRRFHTGEASHGEPDDIRVVKNENEEFIVLVGAGRTDGQKNAEWVLVLQYKDQQFLDATRRALPPSLAGGLVTGQRADVKFHPENSNLLVTVPASSGYVIKECPSCERAYQVVTLEWKGSRYVEVSREWENDRYTVFYVVADALEKRRVDARARPLIDRSIDPLIAEGFPRNGREGWTVQSRVESEAAETGDYEIINGKETIIVTVSKIRGQWKAIRITTKYT